MTDLIDQRTYRSLISVVGQSPYPQGISVVPSNKPNIKPNTRPMNRPNDIDITPDFCAKNQNETSQKKKEKEKNR